VGDDAVLSHLTAAALWKLIRWALGDVVHVTSPRQCMSREGVIVHRSRTLEAQDVDAVERLPVTSVARTLLDISELLPINDVDWALDEALGRKLVTLAEIRELLDRSNGRKGTGILRALVDQRTNNTGSRTKWER